MSEKDDLRSEYSRGDLGEGVRGKYYEQYKDGTNVVVLDPDIAKEFPSSEAVNDALREVLKRRTSSANR